MITLTEKARQEFEEFFKTMPKRPVRVYLIPGGCSGPMCILAMDDITEDDVTEEVDGITFCMAAGLKDMIGGATIDVGAGGGFRCTPDRPIASSCSGSCSSCSGC